MNKLNLIIYLLLILFSTALFSKDSSSSISKAKFDSTAKEKKLKKYKEKQRTRNKRRPINTELLEFERIRWLPQAEKEKAMEKFKKKREKRNRYRLNLLKKMDPLYEKKFKDAFDRMSDSTSTNKEKENEHGN